MTINSRKTSGLIIGKFMPPHLGHQYLVDFARNYVDELHVLVCSLKSEPIPGHLRYKWMKELFPGVNVQHMYHDDFPSEPKDDLEFWRKWKSAISGYLSDKPAQYLFACESYGIPLATLFGMKYIPVSHTRELVPISGTEIRQDPIKNWQYIPVPVKPYFVKRVCIFGPESTGKSMLAENLAKHFDTVHVKEYARSLLDLKEGKRKGTVDYKDLSLIARGQIASEEALAKQANKVLFCDTDLLTTEIWGNILFGKCPEWIKQESKKETYDRYLVLNENVPFTSDKQRYGGDKRQLSLERCIVELEARGRKYSVITGDDWDSRFKQAVGEVEKILKCQKPEVLG